MWMIILGIPLILVLLYKLLIKFFDGDPTFWTKRGVPTCAFTDICNYLDFFLGRVDIIELNRLYYVKNSAERFVGIIEFGSPVLFIRDPELVKSVMVRDYDHFVDRRAFNIIPELGDTSLFNMKGQHWKEVRHAMSPAFSTGKIKRMFDHFQVSGQRMKNYIEAQRSKNNSDEIEVKELFNRYTIDVVAATAFGIESNCLQDDNAIFFKMAAKLTFPTSFKNLICILLAFNFPRFYEWSGFRLFEKDAIKFFRDVVTEALRVRRETPGDYADFLQVLIESAEKDPELSKPAKEEEFMKDYEKDAEIKLENKSNVNAITDEIIIANSIGFFIAGLDTTGALMSLSAYELARNPELQEKLRQEVEDCVGDSDGKITYDAVAKMKYLDMFISEVLRLYPPALGAERKVTTPYKIPGTDVELPKGLLVRVLFAAMQIDENHYPDPQKFDPERFSPENKQLRHPYAFGPFGIGPRNCIGMRFAVTESKSCIATLVKNYEILLSEGTVVKLGMNGAGAIGPQGGLKLILKARTN